jgi:3-ketosteroid 9alpha-monooxygenase subunit B
VPVVRKIPSVVTRVVDHGERVYSVELEPLAPAPRFRPGQFLHLALDEYAPGGFWPESRVFSIASSPLDRDRLTVTYAVKGTFTARMEEELCAGREVWVKMPYGEFVVDPSRDAVLFAGGTGVTAFTAFIQSLRPEHASRILLFYGARTADLLVYGPLVESCARRVPALAARLLVEARDGVLGVDAAWPAIEQLAGPDFYLSGPPAMLTALTDQLSGRGVPRAAVRIDAWE